MEEDELERIARKKLNREFEQFVKAVEHAVSPGDRRRRV